MNLANHLLDMCWVKVTKLNKKVTVVKPFLFNEIAKEVILLQIWNKEKIRVPLRK